MENYKNIIKIIKGVVEMTLQDLKKKANLVGGTIIKLDDGNYRLRYPQGYKGRKKAGGVTFVAGLICYVCKKDCLQSRTTWKAGRKATCTRTCMDRGMYHDMQDKHDGKWWDNYSLVRGYYQRKRKDPKTGKVVRFRRHIENFFNHYGRKPKKGHQLHHINMVKTDDDVSNLHECLPSDHQKFHKQFDKLCKPLMEAGVIGFNPKKDGYYIK